MIDRTRGLASLLAASELVPGEERDLSEALGSSTPEEWLRPDEIPPGRPSREFVFREWLRLNVDVGRIEYWIKALERLDSEFPGVTMVASSEPSYPLRLKEAWDHPPYLFIDGGILPEDANALAVVGSREASTRSLEDAWKISAEAAKRGICVVSGLARGVDTAAHEGALESGGRTIAVVGCGIDVHLRTSSSGLESDIRTRGALVSQFRPGSPASRSTFPLRNAVISGLSSVSLVIDATERSGTRTEADAAVKQGRRVLLWGPSLAEESWAQEFARNPQVGFVQSVEDVFAALADTTEQSIG